jgi:transketolase
VSELKQLRRIDSDLEGHPTPRLAFVDVATGSLGQGLSAGVGMAISARMDGLGFHTYVVMSDGECAEGSVWEAASLAGTRKLTNLTAIVDVNRLGQSQETAFGYHLEVYRKRFEAFGWRTAVIDGHNLKEILAALDSAGEQPLAIVARTVKGQGLPVAGLEGWHGKPLPHDDAVKVIAALRPKAKSGSSVKIEPPPAAPAASPAPAVNGSLRPFSYKRGDAVATRTAYGSALERVGEADRRIVALDGDVENSTYSDKFFKKFPERSVERYRFWRRLPVF